MLIVADANELFSAIIAKGKTLDLFFNSKLELVSPEFILEEFRKYKSEIAEKSKLSEQEVLSFLILLLPKIKLFKLDDYKEFLQEARKISPDINDIDYFALALKLNCPIWSEDKELKKQFKVKVLSTSDLLKTL